MNALLKMAQNAKLASRDLALASSAAKNNALLFAATALAAAAPKILAANQKDVTAAKRAGISPSFIDRLTLNPARIEAMATALRQIAAQPDPIGAIVSDKKTAAGFRLQQVRVPLGVIVMIYESRPNVTIEAAALCLKSGNATILRGGKEALRSNVELAKVFEVAAAQAKLPKNCVQLVRDLDRKNIYRLAQMKGLVDLVIARGSEKMVDDIQKQATVPVLGHGKGVCHVYVDRAADLAMAEKIVVNAKTQRPGVCNAMETLLVHREAAPTYLPKIASALAQAKVTLKGSPQARRILPKIAKATEADWATEYSDLILSIHVVDSLEDAVRHINTYGSGHTDAIITQDDEAAKKFLSSIDSAAVFHNLSTRMHDGGVFGLGAEIGISTQKLHARGSMGATELTTTKYLGLGLGQIRS